MSDKAMFVAYCEPSTREKFRHVLGQYFGVDCNLCSPFIPMAVSDDGKLYMFFF